MEETTGLSFARGVAEIYNFIHGREELITCLKFTKNIKHWDTRYFLLENSLVMLLEKILPIFSIQNIY